ncbi:hypothetical protein ASPWEDRAFT_174367 [Aspergillus wentii DTO 134E9]|uniref:Uncharacterized protein n=1 Tax=Aspergillus wentii DTO 134E9 TaxID=1073089 RepID=A0A1L9RDD6_ASPWE|nr:uncharacterized protein ASPWEDRAFT_174367 [Aspergillus wentii DTO 134E9]OJJ32936.1 hypothetical protein ASPWEDRAFT_174367 [Aspergillus wentii DTO 134E9]
MAREKIAQTERAEWKPREEKELLAWLDYNVQRHGYNSFTESVSGHLRRECNVHYSTEQCTRKLYWFWKHFGNDEAKKVSALHQRGSKCLGYLPQETKDFVFGRLIQLGDREFNSVRRLRSASQISDTAASSNVRGQSSRLPVPSIVIPCKKTLDVESDTRIRKRQRFLRQRYHSSRGDSEDSTSEAMNDCSSISAQENAAASNDEDDPSGAGIEADAMIMVPAPSGTEDVNSKGGTEPIPTPTIEMESLPELEALKKQVQQMSKLQSESDLRIEFLSSRLRLADDRHREDQARLDCVKRTEMAGGGPDDRLEAQEKKIAILQERLIKARDLGRFTRLTSPEEIRSWKPQQIRETMDSVGYWMKQLLFGHKNIHVFDPRNINIDEGLAALAIIRALTAAAIYGRTALRNLDFAAHQSLLNGALFQDHVLPRRAERLACRLSKVLCPLFTDEKGKVRDQMVACGTPSIDLFATWGADEKTWKATRDKIIQIFHRALNIKCQFVTRSYRFEAVLHPPQTRFEPEQMKAETIQGGVLQADGSSMQQNLEVRLCLLPALYALRHDSTQVVYRNFVQRDAHERRDSEQLTKAVVAVEPA